MKRPEQVLHIQCADWLRKQYPKLLWWHTPNGGRRGIREAAALKRMGVLAGVPDFSFVKAFNGWTEIFFIELKAGSGSQSDKQKKFQRMAEKEECAYAICRTLEEFMQTVNRWLK